jgi:hypothetical protein
MVLPNAATRPMATMLALASALRVLRFVFMLSPVEVLK